MATQHTTKTTRHAEDQGATTSPSETAVPQLEGATPLRLDISETLSFTLAHLRRQRTIVLGQSGTGKSNTVAAIAEEGLVHKIPMTIVDPESEYWSLKSLYDLVVVGRSEHADLEVAPEHMGQLAEWSVRQGVPVIIDLDDYTDDEAFALLVPYFQRLWVVCSRIRRDYMVIVDEAQDFIPQSGKTPLKGQLIRIAKKGRKRRIWSVFATQRPQSMDKDYLTQTDLRILHAVSYKHDLEVYADIIPALSGAELAVPVQKLGKGQAYAIYDHVPYLVQIRRRDSFDPNEEPLAGSETVEPALRPLDAAMLEELRARLAAPPDAERMEKEQLLRRIGELEAKLRQKAASSSRSSTRTARTSHSDGEDEVKRLREALAERERVIAEKEALIQELTSRLEAKRGDVQGSRKATSQAASGTLEIGLATVREVHLGAKEQPETSEREQEALRLRAALAQAEERILQLERELQQARGRQREMPAGATTGNEGGQPTEAQRRKLKSLIGRLGALPRFQRALLLLLLEYGEGEVSYEKISQKLHYTLGTVANSSTTALQREGLIERAQTVTGYTLRFFAYCNEKYPGVDPRFVRDQLLSQMATKSGDAL
jgi:hypothetical protein